MAKSRFSIAKKDIVKYFNQLDKKIFSKEEISEILSENREFWRLTSNLRVNKFIELLIGSTPLKKVVLNFRIHPITKYAWEQPGLLDLAISLKPQGYLSHYSAVSYHGLTEQVPKTIYINVEQSQKERGVSELDQLQIDESIKKPVRLSSNFVTFQDHKIFLLNGMYTGQLGVETKEDENVRVTNIERTLIDITIRPEYSGGIYEVVKAFQLAADNVSINKIVSYLDKLNFIYPYHQCIGFYMMVTGKYSSTQLNLLKKIGSSLKFYLIHGMKEMSYSKDWNLYYPSNFQL